MKKHDEIVSYAAAPRIEIVVGRECVVDGLQSIVEYTDDKIKIDLGKYVATFIGDGLYIGSFSREGAVVEGTIMGLEFCSND